MIEKINIACVLWIGNFMKKYYDENDVLNLYKNVKNHIDKNKIDANFYCLTNSEKNIPGKIMLKHNFPGWWSKIELFRNDIPKGKTLYIDLDSKVVSNLSPVINYPGDFVTFNSKTPKWKEKRDKGLVCRYQTSTMMYYPEKYTWIYEKYLEDKDNLINEYRSEQDMFGIWLPGLDTFPDSWLMKLESLRKKELTKNAVFVTGWSSDGDFREPRFANYLKSMV